MEPELPNFFWLRILVVFFEWLCLLIFFEGLWLWLLVFSSAGSGTEQSKTSGSPALLQQSSKSAATTIHTVGVKNL